MTSVRPLTGRACDRLEAGPGLIAAGHAEGETDARQRLNLAPTECSTGSSPTTGNRTRAAKRHCGKGSSASQLIHAIPA